MTLDRPTLLARYGNNAPRYTSFPTANHFHPIPAEEHHRALREAGPRFGVYVHVPYCRQLCWYCGCNTLIRRDGQVGDEHVDGVLTELRALQAHLPSDATMAQLSLGGGTPNFLGIDALRQLLDGLHRILPRESDAELSTELDPRTVLDDQLRTFLALGFSRFSLGVQTLDEAVQKAVNRVMPRQRIRAITETLRSGGARTINYDLMVGLPGQSVTTLEATLDDVVTWAPDRLAVFQYAHVPRLRPAQKLLERAGLPGPRERDDMTRYAAERLVEAGYVRIGFDHYALPTDPLARALAEGTLGRNFQGYTTHDRLDLIGLGPSAIGRLGRLYTQNVRDPRSWIKKVQVGVDPIVRGYRLTANDERTAELIRDLMCQQYALWDLVEVHPDTEVLSHLAPLVEDGLVEIDENGIFVTELGRDFVRQIAAAFDPYLDRSAHSAVA